jgi:hypothetical protein
MASFSNLVYVLQVPEGLTLSEVVKSLPKEVKSKLEVCVHLELHVLLCYLSKLWAR